MIHGIVFIRKRNFHEQRSSTLMDKLPINRTLSNSQSVDLKWLHRYHIYPAPVGALVLPKRDPYCNLFGKYTIYTIYNNLIIIQLILTLSYLCMFKPSFNVENKEYPNCQSCVLHWNKRSNKCCQDL